MNRPSYRSSSYSSLLASLPLRAPALAALAAVVLVCLVAGSGHAAAGDTTRVSVGSSGNQADNHSTYSSVSADGRYVAFVSHASNLVQGDTNGEDDVFVRDRQTGTTERVSVVDGSGDQGNDWSAGPSSISADGRHVAFVSKASNLVADDTNGAYDVFVHELGNGCTITGTAGDDALEGTPGEDTICGLGGNDTIRGLGGDDTLRGAKGDDMLLGGEGGDALEGGGGGDTASYGDSAMKVTASLATGSATGEGTDTFSGIEDLTGSAYNDTFTGSSQPNRLIGSGGADRLYGSGASDELYGGSGPDTLRGGSGNDSRLEGGPEADKLYGEYGHDTLDSKDGVSGNDSLDGGEHTNACVTDATEASVANCQ